MNRGKLAMATRRLLIVANFMTAVVCPEYMPDMPCRCLLSQAIAS